MRRLLKSVYQEMLIMLMAVGLMKVHFENLEQINGELLDQGYSKVKLDELKKMKDFQMYK